MQFPFSVDFIPTFNLFTSSIAVSGKPRFWFNLKDTSEIASIALEDNKRSFVAQVYLAAMWIPLCKRNSDWTEVMGEKEEQALNFIVPGTVGGFQTMD